MTITATEFKRNFSKYLMLASEENILITKNGREIAMLISPVEAKLTALHSLTGIAKNLEVSDIKKARLSQMYSI